MNKTGFSKEGCKEHYMEANTSHRNKWTWGRAGHLRCNLSFMCTLPESILGAVILTIIIVISSSHLYYSER